MLEYFSNEYELAGGLTHELAWGLQLPKYVDYNMLR